MMDSSENAKSHLGSPRYAGICKKALADRQMLPKTAYESRLIRRDLSQCARTDEADVYSRASLTCVRVDALHGVRAAREAWRARDLEDTPKEVTLKGFCENWLGIKGSSVRHGTMKLYWLTVDRLVERFGADTPLSKITPLAAAKSIADLQPERKKKNGEALSAWTRQKMLRHCKTVFKNGVD
jgi:hypothetical protein